MVSSRRKIKQCVTYQLIGKWDKKYLAKLKEVKKGERKEHKSSRRKGNLNSSVSVIKTTKK